MAGEDDMRVFMWAVVLIAIAGVVCWVLFSDDSAPVADDRLPALEARVQNLETEHRKVLQLFAILHPDRVKVEGAERKEKDTK